jgi:hypothetical protein
VVGRIRPTEKANGLPACKYYKKLVKYFGVKQRNKTFHYGLIYERCEDLIKFTENACLAKT